MDPMIDPLDREIGRAVAVEPSTDFVAQVRARIAEDPPAAASGVGWKLTGVVFAASVIAAAVMLRPEPRLAPETASLLASRSIDRPIAVPALAWSRTSPHAVDNVVAAAAATNAPAIIVDQRESRAIRAFMDGTRAARVELLAIAQTPAPAIMEPAPIREILITPISFGLTADSADKGVER